MIERLEILGLKSVRQLKLECKNLNVLVGPNSSGKSTVLQSLLLFSQNMADPVGLNGKMISLGNYREAACVWKRQSIQIIIDYDGENGKLQITEGEGKQNLVYVTFTESIIKDRLNYKNHKIQYLSCQRIGAQDLYQKNLNDDTILGINGEYAPYYLLTHGADEVEEQMCEYKLSSTLLGQVNWWLGYIVGAGISVEDIPGTDFLKVMYRTEQCENIRPKNIGSGDSYLLSLLVMLLASQAEDILIIENPEIHLHPSSQSRLCELFYLVAKSGRQIFVETHSDHIFNGIRAGIAREEMSRDIVCVDFLSLDEEYCSKNTVVQIGKHGSILNQEKYLFDQFDFDLERMLGIS